MSKSMSCPNIAAPGEAFNTVWYVEQIAHAALLINVSMSAGSTKLAMSISEVRSSFRGPDGRAHKWHSLVDALQHEVRLLLE